MSPSTPKPTPTPTATYLPGIREAQPADLPAIVALIHELAGYEQLAHLCHASVEKLQPHLFGADALTGCLVAEVAGADGAGPQVVGFALHFTNFSTFLCQPGLYLEDLYVQPAHRGSGLGKALLVSLARLALARGCGRFDWSVLDWNLPAQQFYERMGAVVMPEWRICRVTGEALSTLAAGGL